MRIIKDHSYIIRREIISKYFKSIIEIVKLHNSHNLKQVVIIWSKHHGPCRLILTRGYSKHKHHPKRLTSKSSIKRILCTCYLLPLVLYFGTIHLRIGITFISTYPAYAHDYVAYNFLHPNW